MAWAVRRTESFDRWWKKEGVDDSNFAFHKNALEEFQNIIVPHDVQTCVFHNTSFECWVARLPDKARKRGKSGGFRVVLVLDLEEKVMLLQGIFRRGNLSFKGKAGKRDRAYSELVGSLAQKFVEAR